MEAGCPCSWNQSRKIYPSCTIASSATKAFVVRFINEIIRSWGPGCSELPTIKREPKRALSAGKSCPYT
eukprot:2237719-Amphidinium_carterae.1